MNTATSVPCGVNTSAASCWMLGSQPALWPDRERRRRPHEPGIARVHQQPQRDPRLTRADAEPKRRAMTGRREHQRHEQRAEIVRRGVLAARECGLVDDAGGRQRVASRSRGPRPLLAGLGQVTAAGEGRRRAEAAGERIDGSCASRARQQLVRGDVGGVEDERALERPGGRGQRIGVVASEHGEQDRELHRARRGEVCTGVVGGGAPAREITHPGGRAHSRACRQARDGVLDCAVDRARRCDLCGRGRQAEDVLDLHRRHDPRPRERLHGQREIARRQSDRAEQERAAAARQAQHAHGAPVGQHPEVRGAGRGDAPDDSGVGLVRHRRSERERDHSEKGRVTAIAHRAPGTGGNWVCGPS